MTVESCGEQHCLVGPRHFSEDATDLGKESHVCHLVSLIDCDNFDLVEKDLLALDEIDEPAGRRDDDICALGNLRDLLVHGCAAVHRGHPQIPGPG